MTAAADHLRVASQGRFLGGDPLTKTVSAILEARFLTIQGESGVAQTIIDSAIREVSNHDAWLLGKLHLEAAHQRIASQQYEAASRSSGSHSCVPTSRQP